MRGMSAWDEQRRFQLVLVALPFTRSLPMHFDFESVRVCYFDIDLGMSSLSNKWEPFF